MGNIRILDDHLANQIAAGEVVERPSSVVKELVENAIDAGSRTIDVTVEEGGVKSIRVVDDGSGMAPEDLELAFERHATSKIRTGKDLFAIRSLGFRGEALPSIAAVARVEVLSGAGEDGVARRIVIEGGTKLAFEEAAAPRGTDFRVRDLFFNTPARLKYMKTVQTELGHITDYMYRLALSRPDIAFRLEHNGTQLLDTAGTGDLQQAAAAVYGTATAKRMIPIAAETPDYKLSGWIARPDVTRSNRGGITVVVNGRYVRNFQVAQAILSGYHTLLPINRYPVAILHIEMEPTLVDVNVHPAKLEVRFSKDAELSEAVQHAVRAALRKETLIPSGMAGREQRRSPNGARPQAVQETLRLYDPKPAPFAEPPRPPSPYAAPRPNASAPTPPAPPRAATAGESRAPYHAAPATPQRLWEPRDAERVLRAMGPLPAAPGRAPGEPMEDSASPVPQADPGEAAASPEAAAPYAPPPSDDDAPDAPDTPNASDAAEEGPRFPQLYPIGQLHGTYIVAQNEDGLFLIDQHAAHERINYEAFYRKFGSVEAVSQLTLFSHTIEFTSAEAQTLRGRLPLLESVGVYLEPFGGNTFKVRSHPSWFPAGEEAALIEEMTQWVLTERSPDVAKIREASAIMCSCKASIKANQPQSHAALEALLSRLAACVNPFTCPHGRPIVVSFTKRDLEKMFKRVM
ncbi:DNA mismatch repair endonuclease MutL [Paenibacillus sp.]|uniref:DNA mismatch repair endonuclease MutL n=1 Tax=Paenibacillus sp. TaxID=58172 RepID=UPI002D6444D1|nr:DNA mismatch repair endonuclease MutL [Paenibacillus sp.]HZG55231.1 DNA mismatch repair endonuclease MutL [Paenibacillus sp.]